MTKVVELTREPLPEKAQNKIVEVYVCPTPGCPDYFGHTNMGDLTKTIVGQKGMNGEAKPVANHRSRADCPVCFQRGDRVERIRVRLVATV